MADIQGDNDPNFLEGTPENDRIRAFGGEDGILGSPGNDTLDGGASEQDEVNYENLDGPVVVNNTDETQGGLAARTADKGDNGQDRLIDVESFILTPFDDSIHLLGISDDQPFVADGAGNDTVVAVETPGTDGVDVISGPGDDSYFGTSSRGERIRFDAWGGFDTDQVRGARVTFTSDDGGTILDPYGGTDMFDSFARFTGSPLNDVFVGAEGRQRLEGRAGDDALTGGDGDDYFRGQEGNDTIDGGAGWDHVDYDDEAEDGAFQGATVDLARGRARDGFGGQDRLSNIEQVDGSEFDDDLRGDEGDNDLDANGGNNFLSGRGGDDTLRADDGNDTLRGGDGDDRLWSGSGEDVFDGGAGWDRIDFDLGDADVTFQVYVNLTDEVIGGLELGAVADPFDVMLVDRGQDSITNIESLHVVNETAHNFIMIGTSGPERFETGAGDDIIYSLGSNEDETSDVFRTAGGDDYIEVGSSRYGSYIQPGSGSDTIMGDDAGEGWWQTLAYAWDDRWDRDINPGNGIAVTFTAARDGSVLDWNGDRDAFEGIDHVQGTRWDDSFVGAEGQQIFFGFGGNDSFDGGDGDNDAVNYGQHRWMEEAYNGIVADLAAGVGTNGLGGTDSYANIEEIWGTDKVDVIRGDDGSNWLDGDAGDDLIEGRGGNDGLKGGSGNDTLNGGAGEEDRAEYDLAIDDVSLSQNADGSVNIETPDGTDLLIGIEYLNLYREDHWIHLAAALAGGSSSKDALGDLEATENQQIEGFAGDDTILGGLGADDLSGGAGDDDISGGSGRDTLLGGAGADTLKGGPDEDNVYGGPGNDLIDATDIGETFSGDWVKPGAGNDTVLGSGETALVYDDIETFGVEINLADGTSVARDGSFRDQISGISRARGTDQDDILIGGDPARDAFENFDPMGGVDEVHGGSGFDRINYHLDDGPNPITLDFGAGTVVDTFGNIDTFTGIEGVRATARDDVLTGSEGFDLFQGLAGADQIDGGAGDFDMVSHRADAFYGGTEGIRADLANGTIKDGFGDTDSVVGIERVYGTEFADRMIAGDFSVQFEGADGNDSLTGGLGADQLYGGSGVDALLGGAGNDLLLPGADADSIVGGAGTDWMVLEGDRADYAYAATATGFRLGENVVQGVEAVVFDDGLVSLGQLASGTGSGADVIDWSTSSAGTAELGGGDDAMTGSAGDDVIDAGTGNDDIAGGGGNDVILAASGSNSLSGETGTDQIAALSGQNVLRGGEGADTLLGGWGADRLEGGEDNDVLVGDLGLGAGDTLLGGSGDDLLTGGLGADVFVFASGDGSDGIGTFDAAGAVTGSDFVSGLDVVFLDGLLDLTTGADALAHVSDTGGIATFAHDGTVISFHGLTAADLSEDDFQIA